MSATTAPPPPPAGPSAGLTNGSISSPLLKSPAPPSPATSTSAAIPKPGTPRTATLNFGQNAVAGPSRPPAPVTATSASTTNPSFSPGAFAGLNGSPMNGGPMPNGSVRPPPQDPSLPVQARLMLAHQAMQANLQHHQQQQQQQAAMAGRNGQQPIAGAAQQNGDGTGGREGGGGAGAPDMSTMAGAMGMLQGMHAMQGGATSKEAMMKQLQALTNTRMQRDRQLSTGSAQAERPSQLMNPPSSSPSMANAQASATFQPTASFPASQPGPHPAPTPPQSAPTPTQTTAPSPAPSQNPPIRPPPCQPSLNGMAANGNGAPGAGQPPGMLDEAAIRAAMANMTTEQREAFIAQQRARMFVTRQQAGMEQGQGQGQPMSSGPGSFQPRPPAVPVGNGPTAPPNQAQASTPSAPTPTASAPAPSSTVPNQSAAAAMAAAMGPQRRQFIQSLLSYHRNMGQTPPAEVFSGPLPGAIEMGSYTVELVDLFMTIMRHANGHAGLLKNGEPHPVFRNYVQTHGFPSQLPSLVNMPKPPGSTLPMPDQTDDPVRFLYMVYVTYLQGFEHHMLRQRSAMMQKQQQQLQQGGQAPGQQGQQGQGQQGQGQQGQGQGQPGQPGQQGQQGPGQGQGQGQGGQQQRGPGQQQLGQPGQQQPGQPGQSQGGQQGQGGPQQGQPTSDQRQAYQQHLQMQQQQGFQQQQQQQQQSQPTQAPTPTVNPFPPPTPTMYNAINPYQAPTPTASTPAAMTAPSPVMSHFPSSMAGASPHTSLPPHVAQSPAGPVHTPSPPAPPTAKGRPKARKDGKAGPAPIQATGLPGTGMGPVTSSPVTATPTSAVAGKKRKKGKKELAAEKAALAAGGGDASVPPTPTTAVSTAGPPARPSTPKRARYKVEYRPLHHPVSHMCGWDERAVASTFAKHNLAQPARSIRELEIVDMEAILMGLRSRMRREMGYGLTVLSMLSMPHPEENSMGLPIARLQDIYLELLELLEELALGDEGLAGWKKAREGKEGKIQEDEQEAKMGFMELEQLGRDSDWSVPDTTDAPKRRRDHTGGDTDLILSIVNLLRNFSVMPDNQPIMAQHPALFHILAAVSDISLARLPTRGTGDEPYSILELGRIRRDYVSILSNLGQHTSLRLVEPWAVLSIHRLLASFLTSAWSALGAKESWYAAYMPVREAPLPIIHSVNRAVEAWCVLSQADTNREVLSKIPGDELVALYKGLVRLLPNTRRQEEALQIHEEVLVMTEFLALSLYSLAFLAPASVRTRMRHVPGALGIILHLIQTTATSTPPPPVLTSGLGAAAPTPPIDGRGNIFHVLCRRLAETLGVLNGTVSCTMDGQVGMSFSAALGGDGDGDGWSFANRPVERGWLAGREEMVLGLIGRNGVDAYVRQELDGMWWAVGE